MQPFALRAAVAALTLTALPALAEADCGKAENVLGNVKITRASGESPLKTGDEVCEGDTVTTVDKDSRAMLKMPGDGPGKENVLHVNPSTSLKIEAYKHDGAKKKVLLNVMYGKMRATVNSKYDPDKKDSPQQFQVKTKSAVAGVRGTDFLTSFAKGKTQVITFEGRVEVGKPGPGGTIMNSVQVSAGFQTTASAGASPAEPKPVPPSQLNQINQSTQAPTAGGGGSSGSDGSQGAGAANGAASGESGGDKQKDGNGGNSGDSGSGSDKKAGGSGANGAGEGSSGGDSAAGGGEKKGNQKPGDKQQAKGPASGGDRRAPASTAPKTSMPIDNADLIGGAKAPVIDPAKHIGGGIPSLPTMIQQPIVPPRACGEFCNIAVQTGPARVNVRICIAGSGC